MTTFHQAETNSGILTSWIPFTTQFSAPSGCSSAIYSQVNAHLIAFDPYYAHLDPLFTTRCLPIEGTAWYFNIVGSPVTSLGPFTCPQAYTTAFTIPGSEQSTRIGCCPSGYNFQGTSVGFGTAGQYTSSLTEGQVLNYLTITEHTGTWFLTSATVGPSGSSLYGVHINGWDFGEVAAAIAASTTSTFSSSITTSPTTYSVVFPSATATDSSFPQTALLPTSNNDNSSSSRGLVTGLTLGAFVVFLFFGLLLKRGRQLRIRALASQATATREEAPLTSTIPQDPTVANSPTIPQESTMANSPTIPQESTVANSRSELHGYYEPVELHGRSIPPTKLDNRTASSEDGLGELYDP